MDHPTDKQLDLWLRLRDSLPAEEAASVEGHVQSCRLCFERVETLKAYYEDLEGELDKEPGERERTIASKIYQSRSRAALPSYSLIQTYEAPLEEHRQTLPVQFVNYIRCHPFGSATITLAAACFAVLFFFVQPSSGIDQNPMYAEVERNILFSYNKQGELLWNMPVPGIPNGSSSEDEATRVNKRFIRIADINGNGENEVLITGSSTTGELSTGILYCFNSDGSLRWQQGPPPPVQFGNRTHSVVANWKITDFFTLESAGIEPRLFVTANSTWFPSVLFELDAGNGDILQTYWHPGWIWASAIHWDTSGGTGKIVLGTTNNSYQNAALAVLNPENVNGYAPLPESYKPEGITRASEIHYFMFKPSLLHRVYGQRLYNEISGLRITDDGTLMIRTRENLQKLGTSVIIIYTLGSDFTILEARGSGVYEKLYSDLYEQGELDEPLTDRFWEDLRNSVLYWDGEQFVNEPVKAE